MSEDKFYTGKLKIAYKGNDLEGFAKDYILNNKLNHADYWDNYLEHFEDEASDNYVVVGDIVYEVVERSSNNTYDDIFEASRNEDGTIDFTVKYYNGGCCFSEAIETALEGLKDK